MARTLKKGSVLDKKSGAQKLAKKVILRAVQKKEKAKSLLRLTRAKDTSKKTRIVITDNTKEISKPVIPKVTETGVVARSQMQLALLSPFRFPIPREQFVGSVARYAGVFFVVIGGFFSLLNLPYATGTFDMSQQAQLYGSGATTTETLDGGILPGTDIQPDPNINVEGGDTVSLVVPVTITVPHANEVKVILKDTSTGHLIPLGSALKIDSSTWRYYWNTTAFHDGEYRFKTVIKNSYGTYDYSDSNNYTVFNTPSETVNPPPAETEEEDDTEDVDDTASTTDDGETPADVPPPVTEILLPKVVLKITDDSSADGVVSLEVNAPGALEVKLYARNINTGAFLYLGYATRIGDARWVFNWKTDMISGGDYRIHAKARIEGNNYESSSRSISIDNEDIDDAEETLDIDVMHETVESESELTPTITLEIPSTHTYSGFIPVLITTSPVLSVEMYVLPKNSLTPRALGRAQKISETSWKYVWDTKQSPNGEYSLYAQTKTVYGFTEGNKKSVRIFNYALETFTEEQESKIDTLQVIKDSLVQTTDRELEVASSTTNAEEGLTPVYIKPISAYINTIEVEDVDRDLIESLLTDFRAELKDKLNELARAKRNGDIDLLARIQEDIEELKKAVLGEVPSSVEKKEIIDSINAYLAEVSSKLQELTIKNEKILAERKGDEIHNDSDKDGISDYDELNLYQTNPFSADSDGDGYIDGAEITLGYNPIDSSSEAFMTYESPKEVGIVREDILTVDSITTLSNDDDAENEIPKRAFITGKGLPNSFVTLYIFSTPIVVTVKTDAEGGWSYVFDKELEEGEHEVYVGITDNAGQIVAKSNPVSFVKTAEAFTVTNTVEGSVVQTADDASLIPINSMFLVASITVVALGLILILLGLHVHGRKVIVGEIQPA